ncbi:MAG TPA: HAMP domain-containing sensor histidine kinase, partial [Thermoanaerobaculia bacterium]|nr:HAMP domain-containing sensor histidine kinase [Thermoanaerobaculia bacterium]
SMQETTSLLLEGTPGALTESQERLLRLNLQCGERLSAMIGDLLEVARLEAGSVDFELEADDLAVVARQALDEAEGSIAARRLTVDARLVPTPVLADRDLVLRLLWNLVSNAVKFSPEGGTVIVRVGRYDNAADLDAAYFRRPGEVPPPVAVCEVEDAGPGIPDDAKSLVFDRFHRDDAKRRGVQGTGLGLSIAHAVATGHGGELWVEDAVAAPTGSRFVLVLPLRRDPQTV